MTLDPSLVESILEAAPKVISSALPKVASSLWSWRRTRRQVTISDVAALALRDPNIERSIRELELPTGCTDQGALRFLESPEFSVAVEQSIALQIATGTSHSGLVRRQLEVAGRLLLTGPDFEVAAFATGLHAVIATSVERILTDLIADGASFAPDERSLASQRLLNAHLEGIERNIALLAEHTRSSLADLLEFAAKYRGAVAFRHRFLEAPLAESQRKIPIDQLFVSPRLRDAATKGSAGDDDHVELRDLVQHGGRNVVLGDPGGGKSTLARKTAYDVSTDATEVCAVFVTVRDYGAAKKDRQLSILEFVRESARTTYQLEEPPSRFFEYIASNGRAVFIFDGLDELLETSYRQEVTGDIESFCHLYPSARVLATARRVGYAEAPLDEALFSSYGLAEFSNEQVGDYVTKWFGSDESLTDAEREALAAAFLSESQAVSDLRSNPLMLALMCNIYKAERYIPRNRPEVYERCSLMMFEQWDRSRGIKVELPFQAHVLAAMQFLAHWIYSSESLQGGVARSQLISKATEYLYPRRFEDPLEAEAAAKVFIKFCTNRAWVFTDVGLTPEGEPLFAFTHRTFLEYFTARHIVRTTGSTEQLTDLLLPRVAAAEWEVVAQLAVQLRNNHQEGAGDEILHRFLDVAATADPGARQLVGFAARCLAFLVPTPELVRRIVANSIDEAVASAPGWHQALYCPPTDNDEDLSSMGEGLATFISSSEENATIVARALADETRRIWAMGGWHTHLAADLLLRAPRWGSRVFADLSLLTEEFRDDLRAIALREWWLSAAALRRGLVSLREVLDRHGLAPLLHIDFSISFFTGEPALASSLQRRDPSRLWPGADVGAADGLAVVGRWLLSLGEPPSPAPYCRVNSAYGGEMANSAAFDEMSREEKVAIVMFAMVSSEKRSMLDNTDRNLPLRLRDTAESGGARVDLMDELGEWGAVVERWLRREVSFVSGTA